MKRYFDRAALGIAAAAFLGAIACYFSFAGHRRTSVAYGEPSSVAGTARYSPQDISSGHSETAVWGDPPAQSWDSRAIFEIFTPPIIFYNPRNGEFTLESPLSLRGSDRGFGIELVDLRRELYRLQYEGYAGDEGDYLVLLRNEVTGAGSRGRVGDRIEVEGYSIVSFEVHRQMVERNGGTPVMEETVILVIFDERARAEIALGPEPRYNPVVEAVFRVQDASLGNISLGAGTSFESDRGRFTVLEIDFPAQSVTVEKIVSGSEVRETLRLFPAKHQDADIQSVPNPREEPPEVDPSDSFTFPF